MDEGRIEVLFTHVTIDELAETSELDRRQRLLLAPVALGRLVPIAAPADFSRLGHARWSEDPEVIEALRARNIDNTRDALVAATADYENCELVTRERKLTGRARRRGIPVVDTMDLLADLGFTLENDCVAQADFIANLAGLVNNIDVLLNHQ